MDKKAVDEYGRPYPDYTKRQPPFLTADALVVKKTKDGSYELLLITRKGEPFHGQYAFPGGHVDYNESPETGCLRELMEETSIKGLSTELLTVRGNPDRDPRRHTVTIAYIVPVEEDAQPIAGDDAATAKFLPISEVIAAKDKLAFDHWEIVKVLLDKLNISY